LLERRFAEKAERFRERRKRCRKEQRFEASRDFMRPCRFRRDAGCWRCPASGTYAGLIRRKSLVNRGIAALVEVPA
jgi:hypothetical protein